MLIYIRYGLATICFAAGLWFLWLWGRVDDFEWCLRISKYKEFIVSVDFGLVNVEIYTAGVSTPMNCRPTGFSFPFLSLVCVASGALLLKIARRSTIIVAAVVAGLLRMVMGL